MIITPLDIVDKEMDIQTWRFFADGAVDVHAVGEELVELVRDVLLEVVADAEYH